MLIYAGIDEAGYGPMFGPLCVASCAFIMNDYDPAKGEPDMWSQLSKVICKTRKEAAPRIAINDSKKLKSNAKHKALTHLERGVLTFLASSTDAIPGNDSEFFKATHSVNHEQDWYKGQTSLPLGNDLNVLKIDTAMLCKHLKEINISCPWMKCTSIDVGDYNEQTKFASKAALNFATAMKHVDGILAQYGDEHPRIMIDRLGGRIQYRQELQLCWPEASIQILAEDQSMSRYRLSLGAKRVTLTFASKSDERHMPVALASMLAKFTRELHMIRFNRYFSAHIPNIKPTAGYVQDGRRFLKEIESILAKNGVPQEQLVRST